MKLSEVVAHRMHSLRLHARVQAVSALEVVRWMVALQAQDHESGLWAIGVRMAGARRTDVAKAIARRKLVRTWPMCGTWHFIPTVDVRWMQDLLASRQLLAMRKRSADHGGTAWAGPTHHGMPRGRRGGTDALDRAQTTTLGTAPAFFAGRPTGGLGCGILALQAGVGSGHGPDLQNRRGNACLTTAKPDPGGSVRRLPLSPLLFSS